MTQPTVPDRRRTWTRWSEAQARAALDELAHSGLSAQAFAEREGISVQRISYWKKRLREQAVPVQSPDAFVAVPIPQRASVEITLGSVVVRVPSHLDPRQIARLVTAIVHEEAWC
jgi:hypothetical protein